jgi:hypothetical protein
MGVLRKAVSVSGPVIRVLLGAGALALLVFGIKRKPKRNLC